MATIYTKAIQEMYVAYFNRPADPAGLAYWEGVVAASAGDTAAVSAAFAGSAEYKAEYEDLNTTGTLRQIYRNLFNDEADAPGLAYWSQQVSTGVVTMDKAVTAIAAGAQGVHKTTFTNKVTVATAFTAALDTDAEKAGYNGELANNAAKEYLAEITTDASVTAALVPATLAASVAGVIKAGVEFTLPTALASYAAAVEARDAFLAEADGDDDEDTSIDVEAEQAAIDALLDVEVANYDSVANTSGVNAAYLADEIALRADNLKTATDDLVDATAVVAKVTGLAGYIANLTATEAAVVSTAATAVVTDGEVVGKLNTYNTLNASAVLKATITADGELAGLIELSGKNLVLAAGITEASDPGITALLAAIKADVAADKAAAAAVTAEALAQRLVDRTDVVAADVAAALDLLKAEMGLTAKPTAIQLEAYSLKLAAALTTAEGTVDAQDDIDAQDAIDAFDLLLADLDLDDAANAATDPYLAALTAAETAADEVAELDEIVDDQAALDAIVTEAGDLQDAVDDVADLFEANDFATPVTLTAFVAGTAEADIFVAGTESSTILNYGSDDLLFIGAQYTLNTGAIATAGNNSVLEVFMTQSGANTVITLETEVFGSNSADAEIVITLTGVNMADVTLANGIISI